MILSTLIPISNLTVACSEGKWVSYFLAFLLITYFISLFFILESKKRKKFKFFFLVLLSQNEFRESRERWWMKQAEERVLLLTSELFMEKRWVRSDGRRKFGHIEERKSEVRLMG